MKKLSKISVFISLLLLMSTSFSCGQKDNSSISDISPLTSFENNTLNEDEKNSDSSSVNDNSEESSEIAENTTNKNESSKAEATQTSTKSNTSIKTTLATNNSSVGETPNNNSANNSEEKNDESLSSGANSDTSEINQNPNNNSSNNSNSNSSNNSSNNTNNQVTTEAPTESVTEYTAKITLGSKINFSGNNVTVEQSKLIITGGGNYFISGKIDDGQIEINTTEKVKLLLNGVNISSQSGPAILISDAKRATIELVEGTTSTINCSSNDLVNNAAIFSNDTLRFKGSGALNLTAESSHGIASDDDIIIEDGVYYISSAKSALTAHDDITINGGTLDVKGGTNGMKSKGTININGGYSIISGGSKEEKSSLYAASTLSYTNGYLFAAGNTVTAPTQTVNPYIIAGFEQTAAANSNVTLFINNNEVVSFSPQNKFKCIMMLTPEIAIDKNFSISIDGNQYSDFIITDTQNIFTIK